eukprot:50891-Eustigmatos_ZCMA.PRE.1
MQLIDINDALRGDSASPSEGSSSRSSCTVGPTLSGCSLFGRAGITPAKHSAHTAGDTTVSTSA